MYIKATSCNSVRPQVWLFEIFDPNLAKFCQNLGQNLLPWDQNGHVTQFTHEYNQNPKFQFEILFSLKVMHLSQFKAIKANTMAALQPSLI